MLLKKIIANYSENPKKPTNTLCRQNVVLLNIKAGGECNNHCTYFKGLTNVIYVSIMEYFLL
jgi:hypothetical protein